MGRLKKALVLALVLSSGGGLVAKAETAKSTLAAQIRTQGFACHKPLQATRDAQLSKSNYAVWVLKCENATYWPISQLGSEGGRTSIGVAGPRVTAFLVARPFATCAIHLIDPHLPGG